MEDINVLKKNTAKGFAWSTFSKFYTLLAQFLITLILARLLVPDDFATIGLLNFFTILSGVLIDSGFAQALIRESKLSPKDYSSVFYFNLVIGLTIYLSLFICAPYISAYFHIPELKTISRVLFLQVIFYSVSIVPRAILSREMRFKELSMSSVISITISSLMAIIAALLGLGVYALVIQLLVLSFIDSLIVRILSKWKLTLEFSMDSVKRLLKFSMYLLFTSLFITFFNNIYTLIIGRNYTQTQLGYYTQSKRVEEVASLSITTMIVNVSYTAMAKVKDDIVLLKKAYQRVLGINLYVVLPIMSFSFVSADYLIPLLLGEQWNLSIPYFKILCIYGAIFPLMSMNGNILKVMGMGGRFLLLEVVRRGLMILFILLTIEYSIELMLWGWVVSMVLSILFSFILCGSPIKYGFWKQIADIAPYMVTSIISAIIPFIFSKTIVLSDFGMLIIMGLLYFVVYIVVSKFLKLPPLYDFNFYIKKVLIRIKSNSL